MRNPTTADFGTEPQSFFFDQTGRFLGQRLPLLSSTSLVKYSILDYNERCLWPQTSNLIGKETQEAILTVFLVG
jgi:hypothetical protein